MAFTTENTVTVGGPTKKKSYDILFDNAALLRDFIRGDNAMGSGQAGHQHAGSSSLTLGSSAVGSTNVIKANVVGSTHIRANAITQSQLKTSYQDISVSNVSSSDYAHTVLTGGQYCLGAYTARVTTEATHLWVSNAARLTTSVLGSRIGHRITRDSGGGGGVIRSRYITASGELFWIFIKRNKITKEIITASASPDHPCFGNSEDIEHPFSPFDPLSEEIIVITPPKSEIAKVYNEAEKDKKKDFWKIFWENYELDELEEDNWPAEDITIGIEKKYNPDLVVTYSAKKAEIEKPTYIKHYKIKSKI